MLTTSPMDAQFRLARIQIFNWGTVSGLTDLAVARKGFLVAGPSGTGKSTIFDANAVLTTPPKWLSFNVAAGESGGRGTSTRNLLSYIRGAYGTKSGPAGDFMQYLRTGTTWSALAQTYKTNTGKTVTIAQAFWLRGKTTLRADVKRVYMVFERDVAITEFANFAAADFDLRTLRGVPGITIHDEFSGYRDHFSRLMGIQTDSVLRVLHKTQASKDLEDLNTFMRDFTLEPPETFSIAKSLVEQFQQLREAHSSVAQARLQIETLAPAEKAFETLKEQRIQQAALRSTYDGLPAFVAHTKHGLLKAAAVATNDSLSGLRAQLGDQEHAAEACRREVANLLAKRDGHSSAALARIEATLLSQQRQLATAERNWPKVQVLAGALDFSTPDSPSTFSQLLATCREQASLQETKQLSLRNQRDELKFTHLSADRDLRAAKTELDTLRAYRSNISVKMQQIRDRICEFTGLTPENLPFAGELLDVAEGEKAVWQGAIERVLRGFAETMLVADKDYAKVSSFINQHHMRGRVRYQRTHLLALPSHIRVAAPLHAKLVFAEHPLKPWLQAEAQSRFDYDCVTTDAEFQASRRAVTAAGQVKHNAASHEKNDSTRVDDKSQWVLGFDTSSAKQELLVAAIAKLQTSVDTQAQAIAAVDLQLRNEDQTLRLLASATGLEWVDVDVAGPRERIEDLKKQEAELRAAASLAELDAALVIAREKATTAQKLCNTTSGQIAAGEQSLKQIEDSCQRLVAAMTPLTEDLQTAIAAVFSKAAATLTLENLDDINASITRSLAHQDKALESSMSGCRQTLEVRFADFLRQWPTKASHLDATEASASGFFEILSNVVNDGLSKFEDRFFKLLSEQGSQELMRLHTQLDAERKAIRRRLEAVNNSLRGVPYNPGTYLTIDARDRQLPEVNTFKQLLRDIFSGATDTSATSAEKRFEALNKLVTRLGSSETADRHWRDLVLDVRAHVDFLARELTTAGDEVEIYRSGKDKSGGQRQKLTGTCLAAALRYQLSNAAGELPSFATIFMDEAGSKSDAEFVTTCMTIFKEFGFQMVVATPMVAVMAFEPFVGGAVSVSISEGKHTHMLPMAYNPKTGSLACSETFRAESALAEDAIA